MYVYKHCNYNPPSTLSYAVRAINTMLSRSAARSAARLAPKHQRRGLAAPASGSYTYQTGNANGIKFASRDVPGPIGSLALVAQAGTRYETVPGLAEGLNRYAFKVGAGGLSKKAIGHPRLTRACTEHRQANVAPDTARV